MSDLRAMLGDRYQATIRAALLTILRDAGWTDHKTNQL